MVVGKIREKIIFVSHSFQFSRLRYGCEEKRLPRIFTLWMVKEEEEKSKI